MHGFRWAAALVMILAGAGGAWAGWEIEQSHYNLRASGAEIYRRGSTMRVSKGRVRVEDPDSVTIFDYENDRIRWILPKKKLYWEGTSDEYLAAAHRAKPKSRLRPGQADTLETPKVDLFDTGDIVEINGKQTRRYMIRVDDYPFQEVWVAESFNLSKDLDQVRLQAMQQKLSHRVRSVHTLVFAELLKNPVYKKMTHEGFAMRTHSYLGEAIMGTDILKITETEIPESEFEVPPAYLFAPLTHLIDEQRDPPPPRATPTKRVPGTPARRK